MPDIKYISGAIPDKETTFGRAWRINLPAVRLAKKFAADATLEQWVVECKWAHPFWHNYVITLLHLRPLEGFPPAKIILKDATHEIWLSAMNPNEVPSLETPVAQQLTPPNFIGQFIAISDADAIERTERSVDEILAHNLSPDVDFRRQWVLRYSDSNIIT